MTSHIETRGVLAGAYTEKNPKSALQHAVEVNDDTGDEKALCGRVKPENIADMYSGNIHGPVTCSGCLVKLDKRERDAKRAERAEEGATMLTLEIIEATTPNVGTIYWAVLHPPMGNRVYSSNGDESRAQVVKWAKEWVKASKGRYKLPRGTK